MDARLPTADDVAQDVPKRRREQRDARVPGLRLRIGKRRSTWVLIARLPGRHPTRYTIGHAPAMSVKEARAEALRVKAALAAGKDPAIRASRGAQTLALSAKSISSTANDGACGGRAKSRETYGGIWRGGGIGPSALSTVRTSCI